MRLPKGMKISEVNGSIIVTLYATQIVHILNGVVTLKTGGWYTMHTKKCMNLILAPYGFKVVQRDGEWLIVNNDVVIEFSNGVTFNLLKEVA